MRVHKQSACIALMESATSSKQLAAHYSTGTDESLPASSIHGRRLLLHGLSVRNSVIQETTGICT